MTDPASLPLRYCPMPGERDPDLPNIDVAAACRSPHGVIEYVLPPDPPPRYRDPRGPLDLIPFRRGILTRHRITAPAPYVGRPFRYEWDAFIDDRNPLRVVAGEARILYLPPDNADPRTWPPLEDYR